MMTVDVLGIDVYLGVIVWAIGMVCIVALLLAVHIDTRDQVCLI